jgi:hypothetical protein
VRHPRPHRLRRVRPHQPVLRKVAAKSPCDQTTPSKCTKAIEDGKKESDTCAPFIDRLVACGTPLMLSCTGSTSISIVGDGMFYGGQNSIVIAGYDVIVGYDVLVSDGTCDVYRRGLAACRTCPTAPGAKTVEALGVGDKCSDTSSPKCAAGLTCKGICTKACSADDDCQARSDGCTLQIQHPNVCAAGQCTRSCSGDTGCRLWVGDSSTCASRACTLL